MNFDITERKRAELELLETSSLLKSILESASEVAIFAGDPSMTIQVFNPGAERLLGYTAAEVVHQATPLLFHDPTEVSARAAELSSLAGEPVEGGAVFMHPLALRQPRDWTFVRKDGARVTVSLVVTAMYGNDGQIFGYLGVAHDVTRQKQYESTLHRAMRDAEQASRAKSQFLANMSHEIRTPMNAVVGLSYLLGQTQLDADQAAFLSKIHIASNSLLALLNDVLDVSKIEAGELELERSAFSLPTLVEEVSELAVVQCQAKGLRFKADLPARLVDAVEGDVTRLAQILNNLLSNAIKFTSQGNVTLRVTELFRSDAEVGLRFEVQDTGIGIPAHVQSRLFAPFAQADASTTRRFGGTGLGLSIVKRLTQLMGGDVGLESEPGRGSSFWVTLTLRIAPPSTVRHESTFTPNHAESRRDGLSGVRVLVADDSDINLFVAKRILQKEGAHVTLARNGQEAVERLRARDERVDVVLMDAHMPVLDGFGAAERIRGELGISSLPIIALTADARPTERQRALAAGMNDFLAKPFNPKDLIRRIQRLTTRCASSPSTLGAAPLRNPAPEWPQLEGIDVAEARRLLAGDSELFHELLVHLVDEYADVAPPSDLEDRTARAAYASRMHKLKGAAGQLGARVISGLAAKLETDCIRAELEGVGELARELEERLAQLRARVETLWSPPQPDHAVAGVAASPAAAPTQLGPIVYLLREQNLAVLEQVEALYPWARATWGTARYQSFVGHVQNLRFAEAAAMLESHLGPSA